jgi:hypothetical protein
MPKLPRYYDNKLILESEKFVNVLLNIFRRYVFESFSEKIYEQFIHTQVKNIDKQGESLVELA